jgi:hypothetical protein
MREKIQVLSLAKECYSMKLDLLTNATVVDDAIRFVTSESQKSKQQMRSSSNSSNEELNEPQYNDTKSDKSSEEKQEEESGEIAITTANHVF